MLKPLTEKQEDSIVNNICAACKDINKLAKRGYNYIYLASGFIAHYNRFGFMQHYSGPMKLYDAIMRNAARNKWDNFRPGDQNYEYYSQKAQIYKKIVTKLKKPA